MKTSSYRKWSPKAYLKEYYLTDGPAEDEVYIFKFVLDFLKKEKKVFPKMLEFGSGPTIHHLIPFARHVQKMYVADYLKSNLNEIQRWIDGDKRAHSWGSYIRGIVALEYIRPGTRQLYERERIIKKEIVSLIRADVYRSKPLVVYKAFPLVTSFYCTECTTGSKLKWSIGMRNLLSLVASGGWIIMSALRRCRGYRAGSHFFPCTYIDKGDVHAILIASGFDPKTIDIRSYRINMWRKSGFESILVFKAMKYV